MTFTTTEGAVDQHGGLEAQAAICLRPILFRCYVSFFR